MQTTSNSFSKSLDRIEVVLDFNEAENLILMDDSVDSLRLASYMDLKGLEECAKNLYLFGIKLELDKTSEGWVIEVQRS